MIRGRESVRRERKVEREREGGRDGGRESEEKMEMMSFDLDLLKEAELNEEKLKVEKRYEGILLPRA